jgi:hypothetical protein
MVENMVEEHGCALTINMLPSGVNEKVWYIFMIHEYCAITHPKACTMLYNSKYAFGRKPICLLRFSAM